MHMIFVVVGRYSYRECVLCGESSPSPSPVLSNMTQSGYIHASFIPYPTPWEVSAVHRSGTIIDVSKRFLPPGPSPHYLHPLFLGLDPSPMQVPPGISPSAESLCSALQMSSQCHSVCS